MRRFSTTLLVLLATCAIPVAAPSFAQDASDIAVRGRVQDGFVRFVFTGTQVPDVKVDEIDKTHLRMTFSKAAKFGDLAAATQGITPVSKLSADSQNVLTLAIEGDTIARFRTLTLGQRLFIDVFTAKPPVASAVPQPSPTPVSTPTPVKKFETVVTKTTTTTPAKAVTLVEPDLDTKAASAPLSAATTTEVTTVTTTPAATTTTAVTPATPAPTPVATTKAATATPAAFLGSAVVTVGSTEGLALAAFERLGYLWVVTSQENLNVPPVVSGPDAALLGRVEKMPMQGGTAFRMKLPKGAYVRPEGAGLVWRLYIDGKKIQLRTTTLDRDFSNTADGPKVHVPMVSANSVLRLHDPEMGDDLAVVTVGRSDARLINSDNYVDFDVLPAYVGAVFRPKADGLRVAVLPTEVTIGRQGGLHISPEGPRTPVVLNMMEGLGGSASGAAKGAPLSRIYNLADWSLGGPKQFLDSRRLLDTRLAMADDSKKIAELIAAAKFMLGQGLPQEGLGFTNMALTYMPMLRDSGDFQAVRGGLLALAGQPDEALTALSTQGLESQEEVKLWKAYATAETGKYLDAGKMILPSAKSYLAGYPARVQVQMIPNLIEAALAGGDAATAEEMLSMYQKAADPTVYRDSDAVISYFKGRLALLRGDLEAASDSFKDAAEGFIGPYPVKATLALVERGLSAKTITREDALSKLERFRFGWRGDTLESDMLQRLGLVYVTGGEQRRGLTILRDAAAMAPDEATRGKLVAVMQKAFKELFSGNTREKMSPLEAAAVATEFAELMPAGGDGEQISLNIADKMLAVDLLDRAADMIDPLVERTTTMANALAYAQKAAAIRITDDKPDDALQVIDKALSRPDVAAATLSPADLKAFALLRAKAKEQQKRIPDAFIELNSIPEDADVLRLKADIAWSSQKWPLAAESMGKLIALSNLDATRPPTREQAQMILNRALALNLSGNLPELENLRIGYGDIMRRTDYYQPFQLVTRTAREAKLADRDTLLKLVSEVNMFKSVLDNYKADVTPKVATQAPKVDVPAAATPAEAPDSQTDQKPVEPGQAAETKS